MLTRRSNPRSARRTGGSERGGGRVIGGNGPRPAGLPEALPHIGITRHIAVADTDDQAKAIARALRSLGAGDRLRLEEFADGFRAEGHLSAGLGYAGKYRTRYCRGAGRRARAYLDTLVSQTASVVFGDMRFEHIEHSSEFSGAALPLFAEHS